MAAQGLVHSFRPDNHRICQCSESDRHLNDVKILARQFRPFPQLYIQGVFLFYDFRDVGDMGGIFRSWQEIKQL